MKIPDLRKLLNTSKREDLEKAFVESYKQLRKAQKKEIYPVLIDILEGKCGGTKEDGCYNRFWGIRKSD